MWTRKRPLRLLDSSPPDELRTLPYPTFCAQTKEYSSINMKKIRTRVMRTMNTQISFFMPLPFFSRVHSGQPEKSTFSLWKISPLSPRWQKIAS